MQLKKAQQKYNIRNFSFFKLYSRISISIAVDIIELFIIIKNNAKLIKSTKDRKHNINFNYNKNRLPT